MDQKINITLGQLQFLLNEQKRLTAKHLLGLTYYYNKKSTDVVSMPIDDIDTDKFIEAADKSEYPKDLEVLKRYL